MEDYSPVNKVDTITIDMQEASELSTITDDSNKSVSACRRRCFIFLDYAFSLSLILLSVKIYLITLEGCKGTQADCLKNIDQTQIKTFAFLLLAVAFMISLNIFLFIYSFVNIVMPLLHLSIFYYLCFVYDVGTDLASHGGYNRAYLIIMFFPCFIFQFLCILWVKFFNSNKLKTTFVSIIVLVSLIVLMLVKVKGSCDNWNDGLKGTKVDFKNGVCQIRQPKICWMSLMNNFFDLSYALGDDCSAFSFDNKEMVLYNSDLPNDVRKVGFPRTESYSYYWDTTLNIFQFKVLRYLFDYEEPNENEVGLLNRTETYIDYTLKPTKLVQELKFDQKLKDEREKIFNDYQSKSQENKKVIAKNLAFIFIDSLSRDNFRRKLPKTKALLDSLYDKSDTFKSDQSKTAKSYQFLKYHGIASWTLANMVPVLFGVDWRDGGSPTNFLKHFKEKGYITGQSHTYCGRELFDLESGNMEGYGWENWDHENNVIFCDPNFMIPSHPYSLFNGPYAIKRRCLYSHDTHSYVFNYGKQFWNAYKGSPKVFRAAFLDAHEGTGEVVKYMDDSLEDFVKFLMQSEDFNDTMIILMADHGMNMPGFYSFIDAYDFNYEKTLPFHYWILPNTLAEKHHKEIRANEQKFLTPYDLHNTLLNICMADEAKYTSLGKSLFTEVDDSKRNCPMFKIPEIYCNCENQQNQYKDLPKDSH